LHVCTLVALTLGTGNGLETAGGASTLTPAEIREAREAADAEFEKEKGKKSGKRRGEGKKGKREAGEDDGFHGSILSGKLQKSAEFLRYKVRVMNYTSLF
jgi:hypothetical protein